MGNFRFIPNEIEGLMVIGQKKYGDSWGYFMETYHEAGFVKAGLSMCFVQDNESKSQKGVLRGLHFQKKNPQGKLVRVIEGQVYALGKLL